MHDQRIVEAIYSLMFCLTWGNSWTNQAKMAGCFCRGAACGALGRASPAPTILPNLTLLSIRSDRISFRLNLPSQARS